MGGVGSDGHLPWPQDTLLACVSKKVPVLLSRGMARLLVIDSVAAPFRCEPDGMASAPRARRLQALGATLRQLSAAYRSPVLCVNQVGALPTPTPIPGKTLGEWAAAVGPPQLTLVWPFQVTEAVEERDTAPGPPG